MQILSYFKRDRFFVLKKNNLVEEFFTIEDALNSSDKQFVIIDKFHELISHPNGFDWRASKFIFVNDANETFNLSNNNWTVHTIETTFKSKNNLEFAVTISDISNKIKILNNCKLNGFRKPDDPNSHDIAIVQMAIDILNEHSKFQSWEQMELDIENKNLKKQIELLKKQIEELKLEK